MNELQLPICAVFFSLLICVVFFCKKRVNLIENKIFSGMLICGLLDSIIVSIERILVLNRTLEEISSLTNHILIFTNKLDFVILVLLTSGLFLYTLLISYNKCKEKIKAILIAIGIVNIITYILIFLLDISLISSNGVISITGLAIYPTYFICGAYLFISIIITLINIKNVTKRHIPILSTIIIFIFLMFIFNINPYIMVISITLTFVNYLMYFTIENPDMQLIEQLNLARDQAEKANNAKTEFLSNMSHEIRTPLNAIVGFSQILKEGDIPHNVREEVDDIVMASGNLLEIVNGILDISKIEANKLEIINTEYSFRKVFNELVSLTRARMGEKVLDFRVSYDESIPGTLYGDHVRVKQIILNLLTNAVKYTKEGYVDFRVSSFVKDDVCRLIVAVEDSGIGIKQENLDKLFAKFERLGVEKSITIEGTGLGLAITKKLVDLMNGKIVVQSVYGQGSKFTVALDQKVVETKEEVVEEKKEVTKIDATNKRVLIVDDNLINLKVASRLLESYKIIVDTANSGFECIDKISAGEKYDFIFLDDMMPKMSGVETLGKLKEMSDFNTPTIALTANAISGMREKYMNDGFNGYLSKPIERAELDKIIEEFANK